jgi:hypothetical protein
MVVGGPGVVDADTYNPGEPDADKMYNATLAALSETAGRVAAEDGFAYANLHAIMMDVMSKAKAALGPAYHVAGAEAAAGIHPASNGHLVMAYAFLKAMGLDGAIGTIDVDLAGETVASGGHRVVSAKDGTIEIESRVYPFCFFGGEKDPNGTRSILPFVPFNRDLNRYLLKVRNLAAPKADVTWGTATRTFSKAELEAGVNLADAFLENPFCEPLAALDQAVTAKQHYEWWMIQVFSSIFRDPYFADGPEVEEAIQTVRRKLFACHQAKADQARELVKPVRHTIRIVPLKENGTPQAIGPPGAAVADAGNASRATARRLAAARTKERSAMP